MWRTRKEFVQLQKAEGTFWGQKKKTWQVSNSQITTQHVPWVKVSDCGNTDGNMQAWDKNREVRESTPVWGAHCFLETQRCVVLISLEWDKLELEIGGARIASRPPISLINTGDMWLLESQVSWWKERNGGHRGTCALKNRWRTRCLTWAALPSTRKSWCPDVHSISKLTNT